MTDGVRRSFPSDQLVVRPDFVDRTDTGSWKETSQILKGHCIEFKYYADGIHSGLTPPG